MLPFIHYHKTLETNVLLMSSEGKKLKCKKRNLFFEDGVCAVSISYVPNTNRAVQSYAAHEIVAFMHDRQTLSCLLDVFAPNWPSGVATL